MPLATAGMFRALLEDEGVPTFVPDEFMKTIDPFITGVSPLDVCLQVPAPAATRALEVLREHRAAAQVELQPSPTTPEGDTNDQEPVQDAEESELSSVGRSIRWASVLSITWPITCPIALIRAPAYFVGVRRLGRRPIHHKLTVWATVWAAVQLVIVGLGILLRLA
ncbi:MAG: hypothetical protein AB7O52_03905 [Planctomycetota bacterium]